MGVGMNGTLHKLLEPTSIDVKSTLLTSEIPDMSVATRRQDSLEDGDTLSLASLIFPRDVASSVTRSWLDGACIIKSQLKLQVRKWDCIHDFRPNQGTVGSRVQRSQIQSTQAL